MATMSRVAGREPHSGSLPLRDEGRLSLDYPRPRVTAAMEGQRQGTLPAKSRASHIHLRRPKPQ